MIIEKQTEINGFTIGDKVYDSFNKRNGVVKGFYRSCYGDICVYLQYNEDDTLDTGVLLSGCKKLEVAAVKKQKEDARNLNELTDHLIKLLESDDKRFSFEFCANGTMEIYDKDKEIGYAVHIAPIEYDENGNALNL